MCRGGTEQCAAAPEPFKQMCPQMAQKPVWLLSLFEQLDAAKLPPLAALVKTTRPSWGTTTRVPLRGQRGPPLSLRTNKRPSGAVSRLACASVGGRGGPRGYPCGGAMGSHGPPQAPMSHFSFFPGFFTCFHGNSARTCGHAITPCDSLSALLTVPCCTIDHLHSSRP